MAAYRARFGFRSVRYLLSFGSAPANTPAEITPPATSIVPLSMSALSIARPAHILKRTIVGGASAQQGPPALGSLAFVLPPTICRTSYTLRSPQDRFARNDVKALGRLIPKRVCRGAARRFLGFRRASLADRFDNGKLVNCHDRRRDPRANQSRNRNRYC